MGAPYTDNGESFCGFAIWNQYIRHDRLGMPSSISRPKYQTDYDRQAGDVWHHLESLGDLIINGLKDAVVYLNDGINFLINKVDDVWQFLLTIGDQVIKIALKTFVAAFKALNFIFGLIGIDLTKILKWIGHLLGFDKMWDTHKMISATMKGKTIP